MSYRKPTTPYSYSNQYVSLPAPPGMPLSVTPDSFLAFTPCLTSPMRVFPLYMPDLKKQAKQFDPMTLDYRRTLPPCCIRPPGTLSYHLHEIASIVTPKTMHISMSMNKPGARVVITRINKRHRTGSSKNLRSTMASNWLRAKAFPRTPASPRDDFLRGTLLMHLSKFSCRLANECFSEATATSLSRYGDLMWSLNRHVLRRKG